MSELRINSERLEKSIRTMGEVGADSVGGGRTRLALTDEDRAGRDLLCSWLREAGCEVRIDKIGNIFGVREGTEKDALPVMMGSHIDSVRNAGMFDGVYGVLLLQFVLFFLLLHQTFALLLQEFLIYHLQVQILILLLFLLFLLK